MNRGERYLIAVDRATVDDSTPAAPDDVADAVDRSPAATTEMLQRLESRGLVSYEPYEGVALSDEGRAAAEPLYETHAVLSTFFRDVLDVDDYEAEAMQLTGSVSPIVAE
jgi:Mn-dependent DtxR family transcriptional regulator